MQEESLVEIVGTKYLEDFMEFGASVVNALSNWTEVEIKRDGSLYKMKFEKVRQFNN